MLIVIPNSFRGLQFSVFRHGRQSVADFCDCFLIDSDKFPVFCEHDLAEVKVKGKE